MLKRPLNPFFAFRKEVYHQLVKNNPGKSVTEITKLIKEQFDKLDEKKLKSLRDTFNK